MLVLCVLAWLVLLFQTGRNAIGCILTSCDATDYDAAMLSRVSGSIIVFSLTIYCANPSRLLVACTLTTSQQMEKLHRLMCRLPGFTQSMMMFQALQDFLYPSNEILYTPKRV